MTAREWLAAACIASALLATGCEREKRELQQSSAASAAVDSVRGNADTNPAAAAAENPYERNAQALAEGKRLFSAFNCNGCHANGGGDKGPALMDDVWIYGSEPRDIVTSILEGRPNGMPAFGGRIAAYQAWQLAAYVRSLAGLVPKDAATSRDDHLQPRPAENRLERQPPHAANQAPR